MRAAVIVIALGAVFAPPAFADTPQEIRFHDGGYDRASVITTDGSGNSHPKSRAIHEQHDASPRRVCRFGLPHDFAARNPGFKQLQPAV